MAEKILGSPNPRISLPALPPFTEDNTLGFHAIEFASTKLGVTLMPHQEYILKAGLSVKEDGRFRFRTVLVIMGRQSGKTLTLQVLTLWRLFVTDAKLIIGTSANLETAVECFRGAVEMAQDNRLPVDHIRWANGQQAITAMSQARYKVLASNRSSARGLSCDLVTLDELREHTHWDAWNAVSKTITAKEMGQRWCFSSGADKDSVVLRSLRGRALTAEPDSDICILEWSAPEDAEIGDHQAWAMANPALGRTVPIEALQGDYATDPPATFRVEVLGQQIDTVDAVVTSDAWNSCYDPGDLTNLKARISLCLDIAPDLKHATLCAAAALPDGRIRLEVVQAWSDTQSLSEDLPELLTRIKPASLGWFPNGPAASLAIELAKIKKAHPFKPQETNAACQGLAASIAGSRIAHNADELLASHILSARKLRSGDGWKFSRRDGGHVDAAYAAAGAVHLAKSLPTNTKLKLITVGR